MIAPKHFIYIPAGFVYSGVLRLPHEHPVTKQNTPPLFWAGRVSLALRLLGDPRRGTPLKQDWFQQAFVTSPGTLSAQQPLRLLQMTASDLQRASSVSPPWPPAPLLALVLAKQHGGRESPTCRNCWSHLMSWEEKNLQQISLLNAASCSWSETARKAQIDSTSAIKLPYIFAWPKHMNTI